MSIYDSIKFITDPDLIRHHSVGVMKNILKVWNRPRSAIRLPSEADSDELDETVVERLADENIEDLAKHAVTFFYDRKTNASYRIEIVEFAGNKRIVLTIVPTGLGKIAARRRAWNSIEQAKSDLR